MAGIKDYSTTASSNTALFPEGMNPANVNNNMRQVQADVRSWYETPQWRDLGHTVAYASAATFTVATNVTASYVANQRIRCTDSSTLYGTIVSSSYSAPNTTVTVTLDSGNLSASLSAVAVGIDPTNNPISASAISGGASLAGTNAFTGTNSFSGNSSFSGTATFTGKLITPDDGELTISSGAITVTGVFHTVDTESDAASDDLDTISGGADGQLLTIRTENSSRDVVVTNAGNIVTPDGNSFTLSSTSMSAVFQYDGALSKWLVLSRAQQAATTTVPGIVEKATTAEAIAQTADKYIDAALVKYNPLIPKVIVNFNGSGGISNGYVVGGSVVRNSAGDYTVTFDAAFDSTSYAVTIFATRGTTVSQHHHLSSKLAGSYRFVLNNNASGTPTDYTDITCVFYGTLA